MKFAQWFTRICLILAVVCVLAAIWQTDSWWQFLVTAAILVLAGAGSAASYQTKGGTRL